MSMSEVELRKQAELRMWSDRIEALKQAGLMPELTESVIGLIQEKVATLEQEKVEAQAENLPEPSIQISQSGEPPEGSSKIKLAQQVQREESPAPASNPMLDLLSDLSDQQAQLPQKPVEAPKQEEPTVRIQPASEESQVGAPRTSTAQQIQREDLPAASSPMLDSLTGTPGQQAPKLPELPKAPEQIKPAAAVAAKEPSEPVPEAKPAIPSAAVQGTEPLSLAEVPQLDEPKVSFSSPDATSPVQAVSQEYSAPTGSTGSTEAQPAIPNRQSYEAPKQDLDELLSISGSQPYDVPGLEAPEQKIESVVETLDSPSLSTGTDSVKGAADALNVSGSGIRVEAELERPSQPATPMSPPPPAGQPKKKPDLQDRRDKALQSKPVSPDRLEPGMLERYRNIQSQQAFRDDSSLRIGGGAYPNATPGGNQAAVYTQQDRLATSTETANAQLGALLERLAREHANLVVHIREANRILDESQY